MVSINEGFAEEITLSNGKKMYTGVNSLNSIYAKKLNLNVKIIRYKGGCIETNINSKAKHEYLRIEIDGINIQIFIDAVATDDEPIK